MKGDKKVIQHLNAQLKNELPEINQNHLHSTMSRTWASKPSTNWPKRLASARAAAAAASARSRCCRKAWRRCATSPWRPSPTSRLWRFLPVPHRAHLP